MRYLPHTQEDIDEMLSIVGCSSIEALFDKIPKELKTDQPLDIPDALSEWELNSHM